MRRALSKDLHLESCRPQLARRAIALLPSESDLNNQLDSLLEKLDEGLALADLSALQEVRNELFHLKETLSAKTHDPKRILSQGFNACAQDIDRAEFLYASGRDPAELAELLDLSLRRIYQLLRMARLPAPIRSEIRKAGVSERKLRPHIKLLLRGNQESSLRLLALACS